MVSKEAHTGMTLRAHHICCLRFWNITFTDRGQAFSETEDRIKDTLRSGGDIPITAGEGPDILCKECPLCVSGKCESPNGSEEQVHKWDSILLRELGLSFGTTLTAKEWQTSIEQKAPFKICQKCRWKDVCSPSAQT